MNAHQGIGHSWPKMISGVPGMGWPAVPSSKGMLLAALLAQLDDSQWLSPAEIASAQVRQLRMLLAHAKVHSRFHAQRLAKLPLDETGNLLDLLSTLPIMRRHDLQTQREDIDSTWYPSEHGKVMIARSTGSTGEPVAVRRTALNDLMWMAMTLREHLWQHRDFSSTLAVIRANLAEGDIRRRGIESPNWGAPVSHLFASGPAHGISLQTDVMRQSEWLNEIRPQYLLTYPNNFSALLDIADADPAKGAGLRRLKQVRTIGETLPDLLRERCKRMLDIDIADVYSSQEVGVIAAECPDRGGYHIMSESVIVELLLDDDSPCAPGERGRIVVTDLHNFATPLIRYDIGDIAELGESCPCGRGLPKLTRILGRQRNLLRLPDGRRFWPTVGALVFRDIAPVQQYQVVQSDVDRIKLKLVVERPISADEEQSLTEVLNRFLGHSFAVDFEYFSHQIPRGPGGKFEDFICEIPFTP